MQLPWTDRPRPSCRSTGKLLGKCQMLVVKVLNVVTAKELVSVDYVLVIKMVLSALLLVIKGVKNVKIANVFGGIY